MGKKKTLFSLTFVAFSFFLFLSINKQMSFQQATPIVVEVTSTPYSCSKTANFSFVYNFKTYKKQVGKGALCRELKIGDRINMNYNPDSKYGNFYFPNENSILSIVIFSILLFLNLAVIINLFFNSKNRDK